MSRVHDMGGRFGDGPVDTNEQPTFKADWEARAHALVMAAMPLGGWNIDQRRHGRECLPPAVYMSASYYEKWLAGLADMLVEGGVLDAAELASGQIAAERPDLAERRVTPEAVRSNADARVPYTRDGAAPRFSPGDRVVTRARAGNAFVPGGHTRLPGYAAGVEGRILRCQGCHIFPDAHAHGLGEAPEPLYAVAFPAAALWDAPENPADDVIVDLWESYLSPA